MKRFFSVSVALALIIGLVGCGKTGGTTTEKAGDTVTSKNPPPPADVKAMPDARKPGMEGAPRPGASKASGDPNYKPKPASGDATKFKGVYVMALSPIQAQINAKLIAKKKPPFYGEINIKGDGNYEFKFGPKGKERVATGTTQANGSEITLTPATINGKPPVSEGDQIAMPGTLSKDGKTLVLHLKQKGVGGGDQKFTRK